MLPGNDEVKFFFGWVKHFFEVQIKLYWNTPTAYSEWISLAFLPCL